MTNWNYRFTALLLCIAIGIYFVFKSDFTFVKESDGRPPEPGIDNVGSGAVAHSPEWNRGRDLFRSSCAACHNPKADGTGPALLGVTARWEAGGDYKGKTGKQWMYVWIHNWHDAIEAGYPYAVTMANSRGTEMNVFASLADKDVDAILNYVENP